MRVIKSLPLGIGDKGSVSTTAIMEETIAIKVNGANNGTLLYYDFSDAAEITIKGSDTVFGGDKKISLPAGFGYYAIDIGPYIIKSGEYKDHIMIHSDSINCTLGLIELI